MKILITLLILFFVGCAGPQMKPIVEERYPNCKVKLVDDSAAKEVYAVHCPGQKPITRTYKKRK